MNVAESGFELMAALVMAPFVAILFGAVAKLLAIVYQATRINGTGQFAEAQASVHHSATVSLDLLQLASSIETWILVIVFVGAVYVLVSGGGRGGSFGGR